MQTFKHVHSYCTISTALLISSNLSVRNCMCEHILHIKQISNLLLCSPPSISQFIAISYLEVKQNQPNKKNKQTNKQTGSSNNTGRINTKTLHYNKVLSGEIACLIVYQFKLAQISKVLLCLTLSWASKTTVIHASILNESVKIATEIVLQYAVIDKHDVSEQAEYI